MKNHAGLGFVFRLSEGAKELHDLLASLPGDDEVCRVIEMQRDPVEACPDTVRYFTEEPTLVSAV